MLFPIVFLDHHHWGGLGAWTIYIHVCMYVCMYIYIYVYIIYLCIGLVQDGDVEILEKQNPSGLTYVNKI